MTIAMMIKLAVATVVCMIVVGLVLGEDEYEE